MSRADLPLARRRAAVQAEKRGPEIRVNVDGHDKIVAVVRVCQGEGATGIVRGLRDDIHNSLNFAIPCVAVLNGTFDANARAKRFKGKRSESPKRERIGPDLVLMVDFPQPGRLCALAKRVIGCLVVVKLIG